jgi:hypothetical protein
VLGLLSLGALLARLAYAPLDVDVVALALVTLGKKVPDEPVPSVVALPAWNWAGREPGLTG